MTFSEAVKSGLDNYANFRGRSSRPAYWWWFLFVLLASIGAGIIDVAIGTFAIRVIVDLALLIPGLAVAVRRLHDINKSGWWIFIFIIPIVGFILWLVWFLREGDAGDNEYGPPPADVGGGAAVAPPPPPAAS
jgi:uncharacterized membrane protein YhaH (DUF805 family)